MDHIKMVITVVETRILLGLCSLPAEADINHQILLFLALGNWSGITLHVLVVKYLHLEFKYTHVLFCMQFGICAQRFGLICSRNVTSLPDMLNITWKAHAEYCWTLCCQIKMNIIYCQNTTSSI